MKVLLTNIWLDEYAGTEVYVRDLSLALHKREQHVEVYSPRLGKVASEIRQAGIHICDRIEDLQEVPDIIHGHQFLPTMDVMARFRNSPAIYFVHDKTYPGDTPPQLPRVMRYVAVDAICREKILNHGVAKQKISTILNWVDTERFYEKTALAARPSRALVFSNNAQPNNYYQIIAEACQKMNIQIDAVGRGFGNSISNPQDTLVNYDIVFAKGKAAIEALASGAALIVCDFRGLGAMVLPENYDFFRKNNFGMNSMTHPIEVDRLCQEIEKFDAQKISLVTSRIRGDADFNTYVDNLLQIYQKAISSYKWKKIFQSRKTDDRIIRSYEQCRAALL
jgi:hypothetical protein